MKANQFVESDEAVSPVIGVILMVAITVVLAAVVFVLVSDLGDTGEDAPDVSFQKDETNDRLKVITAPADLNWNEFQIKTDGDNLTYDLNGAATSADTDTFAGAYVTLETASLSGGDFLELCGTAADETEVTVQIRHSVSNSLVYETKFSTVAACA